jgi:hypothetical protein
MKLYPQSINFIVDIIIGYCGENKLVQRGWAGISQFCHNVGFMEYSHGMSRAPFLKQELNKINGTNELDKIILHLLDKEHFAHNALNPNDTVIALNKILEKNNYKIIGNNFAYRLATLTINQTICITENIEDFEHLSDFINQAQEDLQNQRYWDVIGKARTILEITFKEICRRHNLVFENDINKTFTNIRKYYEMDPKNNQYPDYIKGLITSTANLVNNIAEARNKSSSSHVPEYKPKKHHAQFCLEQSISLMNFIISVDEIYNKEKA